MSKQERVSLYPNTAIFCRNHRRYLERAAEISVDEPSRAITFRATTVWKSGKDAVDVHGPRKMYIAPVGGEGLVEYEATLEKVLLHPERGARATEELLDASLPEIRDEGLWEGEQKPVRTLFAISHCRRLARPFPYTELRKLSDGLPIHKNYGYSYSLVQEI